MATREVGSGKTYSNISTAVGACDDGDTILIYSGTYTDNAVGLYKDDVTFQCATDAEDNFEDVVLSGSNPATAYLIYSYGNNTTWNNLTFTGYQYVPSRVGGADSARIRMSGCLSFDAGNTTDATINIGGNAGTWTGSMESCKIFNMQGDAIRAYADYVEINNCLVVSNDDDDECFNGSAASYPNITASFCTFIGQKSNGPIAQAAKIVNCIVSGSNPGNIEGDASWVGAKGIYSDGSNYNVVTVDGAPFSEADGTDRTTGSANEYTLVAPYFTNAGILGNYNHVTDDYTLVQTKTIASADPTSYYTMEDGTGTTLSDVSTHGGPHRDGTLVNSPTWSGTRKVGSYSLYFQDDGDRHVTLHDVPQDIAGSDMSICFWIKTAFADRSITAVALAINQSDNSNRFGLAVHTDGKWQVNGEGANYFTTHRTLFADDAWHHFCFTFNNTTKLLGTYMDGVYDGAVFIRDGQEDDGTARCTISSSDEMFIGSGYKDGSFVDDFQGYIDELSIWNKILEPEHIKDLYAAGEDDENKATGFSTQAYTNPAIDAGVSFTGSFGAVTTDLSGTTRPQNGAFDIGAYEYFPNDPLWSEYTNQPQLKWGTNFSINSFENMSSNYKYKYSDDNRQAPFFFTARGTPTIRGRTDAYKVEK